VCGGLRRRTHAGRHVGESEEAMSRGEKLPGKKFSALTVRPGKAQRRQPQERRARESARLAQSQPEQPRRKSLELPQ